MTLSSLWLPLECLGPLGAEFRPPLAPFGVPWAPLGASLGTLWLPWDAHGLSLAIFGPPWPPLGPHWEKVSAGTPTAGRWLSSTQPGDKNKPAGIHIRIPAVPGVLGVPGKWSTNSCSDPPFTRAGDQDDVSFTQTPSNDNNDSSKIQGHFLAHI